MRRITKFIFDFFEIYVAVAVFAILIASIFLDVVLRYVFSAPSPQLFELSIYAFVWVIYLGAALAVRYNQHMRFDLVYRNFSPRVRLALDVFFDVLTNLVLLGLLYPSVRYTVDMYRIKASALRVPWSFLLGVFPVFVLLVLAHNFANIARNIAGLRGRAAAETTEVLPWQ